FTADQVAAAKPAAGKKPPQFSLLERFYLSYDKERAGDILVAFSEGATLGIPATVYDTVAGHGSPWDYDRRVPILFWWPNIKPTHSQEPFDTTDIAPTLASFIGVKPPAIDGKCRNIAHNCTSK